MNHSKTQSLIIILSATLLLCTCTSKSARLSENDIKFDSIKVHINPHFLNKSNAPTYTLDLSLTYPVSGLDSERLPAVKQIFMQTLFGEENADLSPKEATNALIANHTDNLKILESEYQIIQNRHEDHDEDEGKPIMMDNCFEIQSNEITFNKDNILSFSENSESYIGGVHPSHNHKHYNINLATATIITESDLFTEGYESALTQIILSKLVKQNDLKEAIELEEIGFFSIDEIIPNKNFSINDDGITYYYNEYEIAAYALGLIKVFIPYQEIRAIVLEGSPIEPLIK